ncbi:hypothetical protein [Paenibacillus foliorum]|uniref:hypothetical protein n=1 Tax=Paenibacillus foliorum TaxID=2654974 RepID=UPI001492C380|nr:hypothetical protein [Paenibacillus foliorum]
MDTIGSSWKGWDSASDDSDDFEFGIFMACDVLQEILGEKFLLMVGIIFWDIKPLQSSTSELHAKKHISAKGSPVFCPKTSHSL